MITKQQARRTRLAAVKIAVVLHSPFSDHSWSYPKYQASLVGPLPHVRTPGGNWAPDYSHPGVRERVRAEVDYVEDERRDF